ncbi:MAG TPA: hypothetical protein VJ302_04405 [Blastocatellia bacterium]|nr:hypothetical protein [Blastocatellia bacterium]
MNRSTFLGAILLLCSFSAIAQAQVYGISAIGETQNGDLIAGYGATALDYELAAYYVGYTESFMYEETTVKDSGAAFDHDVPELSLYVAEVNTETPSHQYAANYAVITDHYLGFYFYHPIYGYYDPYGFRYYGDEYGSDETWYGCTCGGYYSFELMYLGSTEIGLYQPALTVEFQKADGSTLASPLRVGISSVNFDRRQNLKAVVSRPSAAPGFNIEVSGKLTLSDVSRSNNVFTFNIVGSSKSDARGDQYIRARHSSLGLNFERTASVVVPWNVGLPHDTTGGGVVIANIGVNSTTSPADPATASNLYRLITIYARYLNILVVDQFGDGVGAPELYRDSEVFEEFAPGTGFIPINRRITPNSTYVDPTGRVTFKFTPPDTISVNDTQALINWVSAPTQPMPAVTEVQNIRVRIDTFTLLTGIFNRVVTTVPPSGVNISW